MFRLIAALLFIVLLMVPVSAAENVVSGPPGLLQNGERWVCLGDSITAANSYPPLLERMFKLYHPGATIAVINSGQAGDTASSDPEKLAARVLKYNPTIVSIMYGMNEAINLWQPGRDAVAIQTRYRSALKFMVQTLRARGVTVFLMAPTLTDNSTHSYFTLEKTAPFLDQCAIIMRDVAAAEGAYYVPVQREFEALQNRSPAGVVLRADGVHPSGLGNYSIAMTLMRYSGMDKPLRTSLIAPVKQTKGNKPDNLVSNFKVDIKLVRRFAETDAGGVDLLLKSQVARSLKATWSIGDGVHSAEIALAVGDIMWRLPIQLAELLRANGKSAQLLLDLRTDSSHSLKILDLSRTGVLHLVGDKATGTVDSANGNRLVDWEVLRLGDALQLNFDVKARDIVSENVWPFARDGLNLMLDFRPTERFADIGVDREVTQTFLNVREKPFFAVGLRAWTGLGLDFAAQTAGERTETGYKVKLLITDNFNLHTPVKLSERDFVGLLVAVAQHSTPDGKPGFAITTNQINDQPVGLYANNLLILDLKNKITADSIINLHLADASAN